MTIQGARNTCSTALGRSQTLATFVGESAFCSNFGSLSVGHEEADDAANRGPKKMRSSSNHIGGAG